MTVFRHLGLVYGRRFLLALLAGVVLLAVGDFAELASSILGRHDALAVTLALYRAKAPTLLLQALPLALVFGSLLGLAELESSRELLALRGVGASNLRIALPALVLAGITSLVGLTLASDLAPRGMRRAVALQTRTLGRWTWSWTLFHKPRSFFRGPEGEIYQVEAVTQKGQRLEGVTRYTFEGGRLTQLSVASSLGFKAPSSGTGIPAQAQWQASEDALTLSFSGADHDAVHLQAGVFPIALRPSNFGGVLGQPNELDTEQLAQALLIRAQAGRPLLPLQLEQADRKTRPLFGLALTLLALGLAFTLRCPRSAVEGASLGIAVAFFGWMLLASFRALGLADLLTPVLASYAPLLVCGGGGAILLLLGRR